MNQIRIGNGYDIHQLASDRRLILGGVEIPHELGLLGHSDADVLTHAIMDAMLGALSLGDIGLYFPPTDPQWKGADSLVLLSKVNQLIQEKGWRLGNIDSVIVAERPKLKPYIAAMRDRMADQPIKDRNARRADDVAREFDLEAAQQSFADQNHKIDHLPFLHRCARIAL